MKINLNKLNITPGPYFDANVNPPLRKYYGMNYCGSYSKDIFSMLSTWSTDEESDHNGELMENNKQMLLQSPNMLHDWIQTAIRIEKWYKHNPHPIQVLDFIYSDAIKNIEDCTKRSWKEVKELLEEK